MATKKKTILGRTRSGKVVHHARAKVYTERHRAPKWNTDVRLLTSGAPIAIVRRQFPGWSADDHMDAARLHASERDRLTKLWHGAVRRATERYGSPPVYISAGVSEIFPDTVNDRIRAYAHGVTDESTASYAHYSATGKRTPYNRTDLARSYG
jgi:hypothetical protein